MTDFTAFAVRGILCTMTEKRLKRPRDPFQFAKLIGDIATGQVADVAPPSKADEGKDPAAMALGRKGGLKGTLEDCCTEWRLYPGRPVI